MPEDVESECRETIKNYIENLPFNGEYTNMALVDVLQQTDGVKIVEFKGATTTAHGETVVTPINARYIPEAGYFSLGDVTINLQVYE